jgi:hypothetical protein
MKRTQTKDNSKEQQEREASSHGDVKKGPMDKHNKIVVPNVASKKEGQKSFNPYGINL